jgi:hypothetical protein
VSAVIFIVVVVAGAIAIAIWRNGGKAGNARLRGYGVVVDGGQVKSHGRVLGAFAGSHAEVTDPTSRHTLVRVATVAGAFTKKTDAYLTIAFISGTVHQMRLHGAAEIRQASAWVARYNALAGAETIPAAG